MNISFEPKFEYSEETKTQENFDTGENYEYDYEQELLEAITDTTQELDFLAQEFEEDQEEESYLRMKKDDHYMNAA